MSWESLLDQGLVAIDRMAESGTPPPWWALGGGTALMLQLGHRTSHDIDIFVADSQYLPFLSPRLNDAFNEDIDFAEAPHYAKIRYPQGEIDFIAAGPLGESPTRPFIRGPKRSDRCVQTPRRLRA